VIIRDVQTDNAGVQFGIVACDLQSLVWFQDGGKYAWRDGDWTVPPPAMGDFVVKEVG